VSPSLAGLWTSTIGGLEVTARSALGLPSKLVSEVTIVRSTRTGQNARDIAWKARIDERYRGAIERNCPCGGPGIGDRSGDREEGKTKSGESSKAKDLRGRSVSCAGFF
jgi:hypothetical protein